MNCRKEPCAQCPWVVPTKSGQFSRRRYEQLRNTTGRPGEEVGVDAPLFACHKSQAGQELPCAGWLAAVGYYSLRVRLLLARGEIPVEAMVPGDNWPQLHDSFEAMIEAKAGDQGCDLVAIAEDAS